MIMNEDSDTKKEVHVPEYYWKAFCYDNDGVTYSWAYIQVSFWFWFLPEDLGLKGLRENISIMIDNLD